ncbi:MAG: hypothetical protein RMK30_05990 [Anaerolineae bacterium]|nr:hypothetical protein [Anaerolineae bacterium]MDW8102409.1 hypothetical protein [Anaerolineae bacterium]
MKFYITLLGAIFFLGTAILGIFKPDLVWGKPPVPLTKPYQKELLRRKRLIGTIVYALVGLALLFLALKEGKFL